MNGMPKPRMEMLMKTNGAVFGTLMLSFALATGCAEKGDQPAFPAPDAAPAGPPTVAGIAEDRHFASFELPAGGIEAALNAGACSVENIVAVVDEAPASGAAPNQYRVRRDQGYRLVGFVVDKEAGSVPTQARLVLAGRQAYSVPLATGRPRGDVADYFDAPAFGESGFMEDVAFARVAPGDYALYVYDPSSGRYCTTSQSVAVTD
jgi:hypothetical protein